MVLALSVLTLSPPDSAPRRAALASVVVLYLAAMLFSGLGQDPRRLQEAPRACRRDNWATCGVDLWWWTGTTGNLYVATLFLVIALSFPLGLAAALMAACGIPLVLSQKATRGRFTHMPSLWCLLLAGVPYALLGVWTAAS